MASDNHIERCLYRAIDEAVEDNRSDSLEYASYLADKLQDPAKSRAAELEIERAWKLLLLGQKVVIGG